MADMIDAKDAQRLLGCDEETLRGHVSRGVIHGQEVAGKLRVSREDVVKLHDSQGDNLKLDEEDGTIVLTGDSDNLTIDLGSLSDSHDPLSLEGSDAKATGKGRIETQTLTFGDELEVLSFEDPKPTEKRTSKVTDTESTTRPTQQFTDQNTAVMTAVDDAIGTGPVSYNTGLDAAATMMSGSTESSRRSVRSNRVRIESAPVHPMWVGFMALNVVVMVFLVAPYAVLTNWSQEGKDASGNTLRGVEDGFWSGMAAKLAGFSIEPDPAKFKAVNPEGTWEDMKSSDPQAEFRISKYRGALTGPNEKRDSFVITKYSDDGKTASALEGKVVYNVVEIKSAQGGVEINEEKVDIATATVK